MSLKGKEFFPISNGTDLTVRTEVEDKPARKLECRERNEFSPRDRIIPNNLFLRVILGYSRESKERCKYSLNNFNFNQTIYLCSFSEKYSLSVYSKTAAKTLAAYSKLQRKMKIVSRRMKNGSRLNSD